MLSLSFGQSQITFKAFKFCAQAVFNFPIRQPCDLENVSSRRIFYDFPCLGHMESCMQKISMICLSVNVFLCTLYIERRMYPQFGHAMQIFPCSWTAKTINF